ncbi:MULTISPECIES: hypothetical protein [Methylococcus]|uniref:Uncharacterized protein n=1 Tax=Methylococcus capsulatus TaxID=414 RepID=A0ABZ2F541_METCP|nr:MULTISPECIES: hypothetical protein [Methylococcus]MDF9393057.1 hypothetical protein [Methylococcus capsulatus]
MTRVTANLKKYDGYQRLQDSHGCPDNQLRLVFFFQDGIVVAAVKGVDTRMGRTIQQYLGPMTATLMPMGGLARTIQQNMMFLGCHRPDAAHP